MKDSDRIKQINEMLEYQKSIRRRSDEKRWQAYSMVQHRIPSQSCTPDCPVEERKHMYSSAGVDAFESFIAGFMGAFMSPTQEWFTFRLRSKDFYVSVEPDYGHQFTDYLQKSLKDEFDHSNFYQENEMASKDTVAGGYSCLMVQNNPKENMCFYQTLLPWRCWFDKDLQGNWNKFFYEYTLNGYELLEKFPNIDKESRIYNAAARGRTNATFNMLYCIIERNSIRDSKGYSMKFKKRMRFAALEICTNYAMILSESGFTEFPVAIHIWSKSGDSHYGEGMVMKYLAELRKCERLAYEYGLAIAKINHAPFLVPENMYDSFSTDPEARIKYQTKELIPIPLQENIDIKSAREALDVQESKVRHFFRNELFNFFLNTDKVYTATQVNQVKSDALSVIAPVFGTIQSQKIDPEIKMTLQVMIKHKRVIMDPDFVGNKSDYKLEIILDSAIAQQISTYSSINASSVALEYMSAFASLGITGAIDNVDTDNVIRGALLASGAPANYFVTVADRDKKRLEQQQMAQEQLELQNRLTESEIVRNEAGASNLNNAAGFNGGEQ